MGKPENEWQLVKRRGRKASCLEQYYQVDIPELSPVDEYVYTLPPKPVEQYFATQFPNSDYDKLAPPEAEFKRLSELQSWDVSSVEYSKARGEFKYAYIQQFGTSLERFFADYPDFDYNPDAEAKGEFERLRNFKQWHGSRYIHFDQLRKTEIFRQYRAARSEFLDAFVDDFSCFFGEGNCVNDWIYLCDVLGVLNTPRTIFGCKIALENYFVNIYDLYRHVAQRGENSQLTYHDDVETLSQYSIENDLLYPLGRAKTTCMKFLLRRFIGTPGLKYDDWTRSLVPSDDRKFRGFHGVTSGLR